MAIDPLTLVGNRKQMARQSMPADPMDDQITALRQLVTQTKLEMEQMRASHEAERQQSEQTILQQKEYLARWTLEKRNFQSELQFVNSIKEEREKELAYLQDQLEIVSGEKLVLKDTVIALEALLDESRSLRTELDKAVSSKEALEEELSVLKDENAALREKVLESHGLHDQIDDLNHQITLLQDQNERLGKENKNRNIIQNEAPCFPSPIASLQEIQIRIENLTRILQT